MASIRLQDLRRRLYVKAKADKDWRFWGLYVHVAKPEMLRAAYDLAKRNNGAPGIDGVTFEAIEAAGVDAFLAQLRDELAARTYRPLRNRRAEIPSVAEWLAAEGGGPATAGGARQTRSTTERSEEPSRAHGVPRQPSTLQPIRMRRR
jgi:hypothetical protein